MRSMLVLACASLLSMPLALAQRAPQRGGAQVGARGHQGVDTRPMSDGRGPGQGQKRPGPGPGPVMNQAGGPGQALGGGRGATSGPGRGPGGQGPGGQGPGRATPATRELALQALASCRQECLRPGPAQGEERLRCFDRCAAQYGVQAPYAPFQPCVQEYQACAQRQCSSLPGDRQGARAGAIGPGPCSACVPARRACKAAVLARSVSGSDPGTADKATPPTAPTAPTAPIEPAAQQPAEDRPAPAGASDAASLQE